MRGNLARQLVVVKVQVRQEEVAQLSWDGARQLVVVEVQPPQLGEVAQFFRDAARQSLAIEVQLCHMRAGDADARPLADGT